MGRGDTDAGSSGKAVRRHEPPAGWPLKFARRCILAKNTRLFKQTSDCHKSPCRVIIDFPGSRPRCGNLNRERNPKVVPAAPAPFQLSIEEKPKCCCDQNPCATICKSGPCGCYLGSVAISLAGPKNRRHQLHRQKPIAARSKIRRNKATPQNMRKPSGSKPFAAPRQLPIRSSFRDASCASRRLPPRSA